MVSFLVVSTKLLGFFGPEEVQNGPGFEFSFQPTGESTASATSSRRHEESGQISRGSKQPGSHVFRTCLVIDENSWVAKLANSLDPKGFRKDSNAPKLKSQIL